MNMKKKDGILFVAVNLVIASLLSVGIYVPGLKVLVLLIGVTCPFLN